MPINVIKLKKKKERKKFTQSYIVHGWQMHEPNSSICDSSHKVFEHYSVCSLMILCRTSRENLFLDSFMYLWTELSKAQASNNMPPIFLKMQYCLEKCKPIYYWFCGNTFCTTLLET